MNERENINAQNTTSSNVVGDIQKHDIGKAVGEIKRKVNEANSRFEKRNRVTTITIVLMVSVSLFYDLIEAGLDLIPFVGWILSGFVGIFAWLTFYTWTSIKGWGMSDTVKKFLVSKVLPFIGIIPVINIVPEITTGVILTLIFIRAEDTLYNKTKGRV